MPVDLEIGPVSVSIQELNTLPDRYGRIEINQDLSTNLGGLLIQQVAGEASVSNDAAWSAVVGGIDLDLPVEGNINDP